MKDKNIYLWIPYTSQYLYDAISVTRNDLEILKDLVMQGHLIIHVDLSNRLN